MFFGVTSRLYKELVKDKIITGGISTSSTLFDKFLVISIGTYTDDGDIFINKVMDTINKLDDFNEEIFKLYKKNIIVSLILREENIIHTLFPFIDNFSTLLSNNTCLFLPSILKGRMLVGFVMLFQSLFG